MPLTDQKTTDPALYRHELGMLKLLVAKYPDEARRLMKRVVEITPIERQTVVKYRDRR